MAITEQHRKEDLGQAFVTATIAKAGFTVSYSNHDYGIDGLIKDIAKADHGYYETGFGINYQLKSSWDVSFDGNYIVYDLESRNYNDLILERTMLPSILILFVLPENESQWLTVSEDQMIIKKSAWWCSLKGLPPTHNTSKKRIRIPKNQLLTPDSLTYLMDKVREGEQL